MSGQSSTPMLQRGLGTLRPILWACTAFFLSNSSFAAPTPLVQPKPAIAFTGDPQIGYGGTIFDYIHFGKVVDAVNASPAEALIVAGDLSQDRTALQRWLFRRVLQRLRPSALLVPGNHDVVNEASLQDYREEFGDDYYLRDIGDVSVLVVNSETARSPELSPYDYEAQWEFLSESASRISGAGRKSIVVTHRPPFVSDEREPATGSNWPEPERTRLLSLCRAAGIELILAGHLHRTQIAHTKDGIEIRVLSGSARSFDGSNIGFETLRPTKDGFSTEFSYVSAPRKAPQSIPGFQDWTPRLLDFSFGHWFFSLLFFGAGYTCLKAARAQVQPSRSRTWMWLAWAMLFFGLNQQLDLDEFLSAVGRITARLVGIAPIRHLVTGTALTILVVYSVRRLVASFGLNITSRERGALVATAVPSLWFILSVISHHDIGMVLSETWWDILTFLALLVVLLLGRQAYISQVRQRAR